MNAPAEDPMEPLAPGLLRDLRFSEAYPHDPSATRGIESLQTHISQLFLTSERVYKLRKAVDLGFLCFATRAQRNADCVREVELNRRLASDVYLGVAPLLRAPGPDGAERWQVGELQEPPLPGGADGTAPEHCVVMRRLPGGRDALALLGNGRLRAEQLDAVAERLAAFHARHGLGAPPPISASEWREALLAPVRANFETLLHCGLPGLAAERVARVARAAQEGFAARETALESRRRQGRVVDGHGDVHLQHVWFETDTSPPLLVDCIEFNDELRRVDVASEVAFLAMDLAYRGQPQLAERFLRSYAATADDTDLYRVVDWFGSYRAGVRAKVAALAAADAAIPTPQRDAAAESAERHLALAEAFLAPAERGALVLVCGAVGTGKSTVAGRIADACGGVVVSSDRTRKHLAGLAPTDRSAAGEGLYREEHKEAVYAALLERAAPVLESGRTVVLDASFARRRYRDAARAWAGQQGLPVWLVVADCPDPIARERLARRQATGRDASDAGPELLDWSRAHFESPEEWPSATYLRVATDGSGWRDALSSLGKELPSRWPRSR